MEIISLILFTLVLSCLAAEVPQSKPTVKESIIIEKVPFIKIGTYRGTTDDGTEYQKSYFFPRYSPTVTFYVSRTICQSYNLELITFETRAEMDAVFAMSDSYLRTLMDRGILVDAMTLTVKSPTDWYWTKSGQKLSFSLPWIPGEPNNSNNLNEACLTFGKRSTGGSTGFNDVSCLSTSYSFLCQKIEFSMPSEN